MGWSADSAGGNDTSPVAAFDLPPATLTLRSITGTVHDADTGAPVAGAAVTLGFQGAGVVDPTTVTRPDGSFRLPDIPVGSYQTLQVLSRQYRETTGVTVRASGARVHLTPSSQ